MCAKTLWWGVGSLFKTSDRGYVGRAAWDGRCQVSSKGVSAWKEGGVLVKQKHGLAELQSVMSECGLYILLDNNSLASRRIGIDKGEDGLEGSGRFHGAVCKCVGRGACF